MLDHPPPPARVPRALIVFCILGIYLTLRGYHSRDGDQAYRLPILLHQQDPALFDADPFVRAFDAFNPHRGYLALLDMASRPFGLSLALFGLFALTFGATCVGIDRLARAAWPERGSRVGLVAVALVLIAKAGNIGTNHLFEAMLLDRLLGFALGWLALAAVVERPERAGWVSALLIGLAALIHPSVGLQLGMLVGIGWIVAACVPSRTGITARMALRALLALGLALVPGVLLNAGQGARLFEGLPADEFRLLSVELQGPQHMLPHLWRLPQWLAWACYPILALVALGTSREETPFPPARARLAVFLGVNLVGLGLAWFAVEVVGDLRLILFQPFRMATVFRGLALVAVSGRVLALWRTGDTIERARATFLTVGLAGDWSFVVATAFDLSLSVCDALCVRFRATGCHGFGTPTPCARPMVNVHGVGVPNPWHPEKPSIPDRLWLRSAVGAAVLGFGLTFLARHDTESGHWPLLAAVGVPVLGSLSGIGRGWAWNRRRLAWTVVGCWTIPMLALLAGTTGGSSPRWARGLVANCRFGESPVDDVERLAVWCRAHTPSDARFIGPPGPKTFRLWSRRNVAFNRAASPYHAEGLADWSARFRAHVGFEGQTVAFVQSYQKDRHGLEGRYQALSDAGRAALARDQGASYVVAAAPRTKNVNGPLELLHVEGRYAVYRVRTDVPTPSSDELAGR